MWAQGNPTPKMFWELPDTDDPGVEYSSSSKLLVHRYADGSFRLIVSLAGTSFSQLWVSDTVLTM